MSKEETLAQFRALVSTDYIRCMQCGRCSAACPMGQEMDVLPNKMVWYLLQGDYDKIMSAKSPWKCLSCMACASRCPRNVSPAHVMEAARLECIRQQGNNQVTPEMLENYDADMPQQALVAAFRKFIK